MLLCGWLEIALEEAGALLCGLLEVTLDAGALLCGWLEVALDAGVLLCGWLEIALEEAGALSGSEEFSEKTDDMYDSPESFNSGLALQPARRQQASIKAKVFFINDPFIKS